MKRSLVAGGVFLLLSGGSVWAHRLDEYLQATTISLEKNRLQAQIRLTPGVAVFPIVFAGLDTNGDGLISGAEQQAYAARVLGDLSVTLDGMPLQLRLLSAKFPEIDDMKQGLGEIVLDVEAEAPRGGSNRRLTFENRHQSRVGAYLVNCLVPRDPDIRITSQYRNYVQSFYQVDYSQASGIGSSGRWLMLLALAGFAALGASGVSLITKRGSSLPLPNAEQSGLCHRDRWGLRHF